jgi:lysophospholipase L1-like esterase
VGLTRHRFPAILGSLTAAALTLGLTSAPAQAAAVPVPARMASLGDSITRGFNACGFYVDCTSRSWSTGSSTSINSHFVRLRAQNPALLAANLADSGARMSALAGQASEAVSSRSDYVTILMGANDACRSTEADMTSVATFETQFRTAMTTLRQGLPEAYIFVSSIPDIHRLWEVGRTSLLARTAWNLFGICQAMLASPTSTATADVDRRTRVRQRVIDYNAALARVCASDARCRFDDNAVFNYRFSFSQVSEWDYFHPNAAGQTVLADVSYAQSFWSSAVVPSAR